ncbi:MAG: hypothetical protein IKH05_09715 [Bacteroidaceae bacterium]|jgi:hypothetical protein|nr:hypothetical protein [Bacteroidaceae bacterium]
MLKRLVVRLMVCAVVLSVLLPIEAAVRRKRVPAKPDTLSLVDKMQDLGRTGRMSCSTFPVKIHISGRAVQIQSDHSQILPIYTRGGAFYMAVRLNKGMNWLNGLPRGHYFINNRPITIN